MEQTHLRFLNHVKWHMNRFGLAVLLSFIVYSTLPAQSLVPEPAFLNPQLKTGPGSPGAGKDGAVYIFPNVGVGIDALIAIQGRSSSKVTLSNIDLEGPEQDPAKGTGYDNAWQPRVKYGNGRAAAHSSWWMEFKISFVKHADPSQSVSVNQFFVSGLDIDGDGDKLHEFQSFYKMQSFTLEQHSMMTYASVRGCLNDRQLDGKRFDGTAKDYAGITTGAPDAMVNNFYSDASSFVVRVGAETGSGSSKSTDRMYALWFRSLTYDVPVASPLPVSLIAFDAKLKNNRQVTLTWTTGSGEKIGHFTVQCSRDGKEFDDHAILFTEDNNERSTDFHFTDNLSAQKGPLVFYRLKLAGPGDAGFQYSDIILVRIPPRQPGLLVSANQAPAEWIPGTGNRPANGLFN
jgi:hypothetical protein